MRAPKRYFHPMFVVAFVFSVFACVDRNNPTEPGASTTSSAASAADASSVSVELPVSSLEVGRAANAVATPLNQAGQALASTAVEWTSSDTSVLTVSNNGTVTAKRMGAASVWARSGGIVGRRAINVTDTVPGKVVASPAIAITRVDRSVQLAATVTTHTGRKLDGHAITWRSTMPQYATVSQTGVVTAKRRGSSKIIALAGAVADTSFVVVLPSSISKLSLTPNSATVSSGRTLSLAAQAKDASGAVLTSPTLGWTSSNAGVATVSTSGVVTGVKPGSATITASAAGVKARSTIKVTAGAAATVKISPTSVGLVAGSTQRLSATLADASGNPVPLQTVTWSTSDANIATVSSTGVVTARRSGNATISAASHGVSGKVPVAVAAGAVKSISVAPTTVSLTTGGKRQMSATLTDVSGNMVTEQSIAWSSTDNTVATVSSSGVVTARHSGKATIRAAAGGATDDSPVSVGAGQVTSVSVSASSPSLVAGQTEQLVATLKDSTGSLVTGQSVSWKSSNATVASVSSTGVATGLHTGNATITATVNGISDGAALSVAGGAVSTVAISPSSDSIVDGKTLQMSASFADAEGNPVAANTVTWKSSNTAVATVSGSGLVTAVSPGTTSITVTADGQSKSASITVTAVPKATLSSLTLNPNSVSVAGGATQRFTVSATWSDGSTTPPAVTYSATGGTITSAGVYTAGTASGTFRVVATVQGGTKSDSSVVTIAATSSTQPTLSKVAISPSTVTLAPNGTAQFRAAATWSDGSTTSTAASYSATGGSITSGGLYTAGSTGGNFLVIASDAGRADTSFVTITPPVTSPISQGASCSNPQSVNTTSELTSALAQAGPGDCIVLAAGTYTLGSGLTIANSGSASSPIVVEGTGSNTVIDVNQKTLSISASYLHLRKMRLTNFPTVGLWLRGATGDVLDSIEIDHTQQEAIAIKDGSNHNVLKNSRIHDTGLSNGQYAEGIYVGSSGESSPLDFRVTDNQILNNHFGPNVRAEAIDLKEGADRTVIRGNYIDGTGAYYYSGTGTLIAVKSSGVLIDSNYMQIGMHQAVAFEAPVASVMSGNVATRNQIDLRTSGYGFQFQVGTVDPMGAVVKCDNVMITGELSNRPCSP